MRFSRGVIPLFAVGVVLLVFVGGGAAAEIEGAGTPVEITDEDEQLQALAEEASDQLGYEPQQAMYVFGPDGEAYILFGALDPKAGYVTANDAVTIPHPAANITAVYSTDVEIKTESTPAELSNLQQNPGAYTDDVYEVSGHYEQISARFDPSEETFEPTRYEAVGGFGNSRSVEDPAAAATWATLNASWSVNDSGTSYPGTDSEIVAINTGPSMWLSTDAEVSGMVVDMGQRQPSLDGFGPLFGDHDSYLFIVTDISPTIQPEVEPEAVASGEIEEGRYVRVEAPASEFQMSVRDQLVSAAPCGPPNTIVFPPTGCLPLTHDVSLRIGAAGNPGTEQPMLFIGADNREYLLGIANSTGQYHIQGEVVSAESVGLPASRGNILRADEIQRMENSTTPDIVNEYSNDVYLRTRERLRDYDPEQQAAVNPDSEAALPTARLTITDWEFVNRWGEAGDEVVVEVTLENQNNVTGQGTVRLQAAGNTFHRETVRLQPGKSATVRGSYEISKDARQQVSIDDFDIGMAGYRSQTPVESDRPDQEESSENEEALSRYIDFARAFGLLAAVGTIWGLPMYLIYRRIEW